MGTYKKALLLSLLAVFCMPTLMAWGPRKRKTLEFSSSWVTTEQPKKPMPFPFRKKNVRQNAQRGKSQAASNSADTSKAAAANATASKELVEPKIQTTEPSKAPPRKKRILIFSSNGGGCHTAAANGLCAYLFDDYEVKVVNIFRDVLAQLDTLGSLTFGRMSGEDLYNFCLRARWTGVAEGLVNIGLSVYNWRQPTVENILIEYFKFAKPDLMISVVPVLNGGIYGVAEKLNIPFLCLTLDTDTTWFAHGIVKPTFKKFRYTIPFEDVEIREKIKPAEIPSDQVVVTGYPVRPEFFMPKDVAALKKEFNVPVDKPVVMVLMGGAGSLTSYRYARIMARLGLPLHMIIVLGRNESLKRNINKIMLPKDVTMTLLGFSNRIADLMAISDVIITKPGPGSVYESLESNLPMILDTTQGVMWWEKMNLTFTGKNGFAECLNDVQDLEKMLPRYLKKDEFVVSIKKKMRDYKRERYDKKIKPLIEEMLAL